MSTDSRDSREDKADAPDRPEFSWMMNFFRWEKELVRTSLSRDHVNLTGSSPKASQIMVTLSPTRARRDSKFLAKWAGVLTLTKTGRDKMDAIVLEEPHKYSPSSDFSASKMTRDPFSKTWTCGPLTMPIKSLLRLEEEEEWGLMLLLLLLLEKAWVSWYGLWRWRILLLLVICLDFFHWWIGTGYPWVWQSMIRFLPWRTAYSRFGSKIHFGLAIQQRNMIHERMTEKKTKAKRSMNLVIVIDKNRERMSLRSSFKERKMWPLLLVLQSFSQRNSIPTSKSGRHRRDIQKYCFHQKT